MECVEFIVYFFRILSFSISISNELSFFASDAHHVTNVNAGFIESIFAKCFIVNWANACVQYMCFSQFQCSL